MKSVAIVGASSHVAKNLIAQNQAWCHWNVDCYARNQGAVEIFLSNDPHARYAGEPISFGTSAKRTAYDAIINCVGFGTPDKVRQAGLDLFTVTEEIDNRIIDYLKRQPGARYVNFSSGAVYGTSAASPVGPGFRAEIEVTPLKSAEFYRISKLHQEAKHRVMADFPIVDLRLFSFFSRYIERNGGFLMTDIIDSLSTGQALRTGPADIFRDYIAPSDLYVMIDSILESPALNAAFDTFSAGPIAKTELLERLKREFGLQVIVEGPRGDSPTGLKPYYYSLDRSASEVLGYVPALSSWEGIAIELEAMEFPRFSPA